MTSQLGTTCTCGQTESSVTLTNKGQKKGQMWRQTEKKGWGHNIQFIQPHQTSYVPGLCKS